MSSAWKIRCRRMNSIFGTWGERWNWRRAAKDTSSRIRWSAVFWSVRTASSARDGTSDSAATMLKSRRCAWPAPVRGRDRLRHAGTLLPHRQNATLHSALIAAGIHRVLAAMKDPFPAVNGRGLAELAAAGIEVDIGPLEEAARHLNAPYLKRLTVQRPWLIAKWAMSLDGKIATPTAIADGFRRQLRSKSAINCVAESMAFWSAAARHRPTIRCWWPVRRDRAERPESSPTRGPRSPLKVSWFAPRSEPVLIAAGSESSPADRQRLTDAGCEVYICNGSTPAERLASLLDELGRRRMTNVLVEGGSRLLGSLWDIDAIDEVHVFIAPKLIGGGESPSPLGGQGLSRIAEVLPLVEPKTQFIGDDIYISARVDHRPAGG